MYEVELAALKKEAEEARSTARYHGGLALWHDTKYRNFIASAEELENEIAALEHSMRVMGEK